MNNIYLYHYIITRTDHGRCGYHLHKWGFKDNPVCDCGNGKQTINHIVVDFQGRKFNQGFEASDTRSNRLDYRTSTSVYEPTSQERLTFNINDS